MIIEFKSEIPESFINDFAAEARGHVRKFNGCRFVIVSDYYDMNINQDTLGDKIVRFFKSVDDWPLSSRALKPENTIIDLGDGVVFGSDKTVLIAGPCAAESEARLYKSAQYLKSLDIKVLRAGLFKPRSSAYSFQGLGREGLKLLAAVKRDFGLKIITEIYDSVHVEDIATVADIIQIGSKAMFNHEILKRCGRLNKPVLLKRNFSATTDEWLESADTILSEGNPNVILCERGIRTYEKSSRFTLDLNSAIYVKHHSHLPILIDPSHAFGEAYGVPELALSAAALSVDALMLEVHPCPDEALCDRRQALTHETFLKLKKDIAAVCSIVGRTLV